MVIKDPFMIDFNDGRRVCRCDRGGPCRVLLEPRRKNRIFVCSHRRTECIMTYLDQKKFRKFQDPDINPCIKEAELSIQCLEENHYSNSKCGDFFDNYNNCKEFWNMIKKQRIKDNIRPMLPSEEERKLILAEREKGNRVHTVKVDSK